MWWSWLWDWLTSFWKVSGESKAIECIPKKPRQLLDENFKKLPVHAKLEEKGAFFTPFLGFHVPLNYEGQSLAYEVLETRKNVSLFDASYKKQFYLYGNDCSSFLEELVTSDIKTLKEEQSVLTLMTNNQGGIIDDLLVSKIEDSKLHVTANTPKVLTEIQKHLNIFKGHVYVDTPYEECYFTLQGPENGNFFKEFSFGELIPFMHNEEVGANHCELITRYSDTGEDGWAIMCYEGNYLMESLFAIFDEKMILIGLEAKECLRIEAGNCLSGTDFDETTTPVEAGLTHLIGKRRREEGGFPGSEIILKQLKDKPTKKRVGFTSKGSCPKGGAEIKSSDGVIIGKVTSGCYSPSLELNIGMGYVDLKFAEIGTELLFRINDEDVKGVVTKMPFVPTIFSANNDEK